MTRNSDDSRRTKQEKHSPEPSPREGRAKRPQTPAPPPTPITSDPPADPDADADDVGHIGEIAFPNNQSGSRKSLSSLFAAHDRQRLETAWKTTEAADEYTPLPSGEYNTHIVAGELTQSRNKKPGYKLTFEVLEGEHSGRRIWHDIWLTEPAIPMAKRDLAKLGVPVKDFVNMMKCLEKPLPQGIRCMVRLAVRTDDDGNKRNRVQTFTVLDIDKPVRNAFHPDVVSEEGAEDSTPDSAVEEEEPDGENAVETDPELTEDEE